MKPFIQTKQTIHILAMLALLIISWRPAQSQVTIGSQVNANPGALLDLKENDSINANSTKGLALPRVYLEDPGLLYPMLRHKASYVNGSTKKEDEKQHTGLLVYNLTTDNKHGLCEGTYLWKEKQWVRLSPPCTSQACLYDINSNKTPGKQYTFYCQDKEGRAEEAETICKDGFQEIGLHQTYHLLTYTEFIETWNQSPEHYKPSSRYLINYNGWITLGIIRSDMSMYILGDIGNHSPGLSIGGLLSGTYTVRCVKD